MRATPIIRRLSTVLQPLPFEYTLTHRCARLLPRRFLEETYGRAQSERDNVGLGTQPC
jgi:hypothetical protein